MTARMIAKESEEVTKMARKVAAVCTDKRMKNVSVMYVRSYTMNIVYVLHVCVYVCNALCIHICMWLYVCAYEYIMRHMFICTYTLFIYACVSACKYVLKFYSYA